MERKVHQRKLQEEVQISDLDVSLQTDSRNIKWPLFLLNCFMLMSGIVGGPLTTRYYYNNGGSRKWIPSWIQSAGFPILLIPLSILYYQHKNQLKYELDEPSTEQFFAGKKLMLCSFGIGLIIGVDNFMYSIGLSYIPLSTVTILIATQLAFTAIFAFLLVKQKFTTFSINAVVLMTLGSILLAFGKSGDKPAGVSQEEYFLGFFVTLGASAIVGLYLPLIELSYAKAAGPRRITYAIVTQVQLVVGLTATTFATIGMLVNHDFRALPKEAKQFGLGEAKYYVLLSSAAIAYQFMTVGALGVIFCSTSLLCGILTAVMIPVTEVIAALVFKEKFTGLKGMSLAMCLWGVTSYFYGEYRMTKKMKEKLKATAIASDSSHGPEPALHSV